MERKAGRLREGLQAGNSSLPPRLETPQHVSTEDTEGMSASSAVPNLAMAGDRRNQR